MAKIILLILFLITVVRANETHVTFYCDDSYVPYSYTDHNQQCLGIYSEILREAFRAMPEYKITLTPVPWKRAQTQLKDGYAFAIYPPYYRPEFRPYVGAYSKAILEEEIIVLSRAEFKNLKKWPQDWFGKNITMFLGALDIGGAEFLKAYENKKIFVVENRGNERNIELVTTGRQDAYVNDRLAINYTIDRMKKHGVWPKNAQEIMEVTVVGKEKGYIAYSNNLEKYPFRDDLISKLDQQIKKLQENGFIAKLLENYSNL